MKNHSYANLPVVLTALLVLALPCSGWAQFIYTTNNGTITITAYLGTGGSGGSVTIPSTISGYPVTSIGTNAFFNSYGLTNVTIPDSITNISKKEFLLVST